MEPFKNVLKRTREGYSRFISETSTSIFPDPDPITDLEVSPAATRSVKTIDHSSSKTAPTNPANTNKTDSVSKFLQGTFGSEIPVSDDEEEIITITENSSTTATTVEEPLPLPLYRSNPPKQLRSRQLHEEEGKISDLQPDSDATAGPARMPKQRKPFLTGTLRVTNTLEAPRSERGQLIQASPNRSYLKRLGVQPKESTDQYKRQNNHDHPYKKPRRDQESVARRSTTPTNDINCDHETVNLEGGSTEESARQETGIRARQATKYEILSESEGSTSNQDKKLQSKTSTGLTRSRVSSMDGQPTHEFSSDELFDNGSDAGDFMKAAKMEREAETLDSLPAKDQELYNKLNGLLSADLPDVSRNSTALVAKPPSKSRDQYNTPISKSSRITKRLDPGDSPDELNSDSTMQADAKGPHQSNKSVRHSPTASRRSQASGTGKQIREKQSALPEKAFALTSFVCPGIITTRGYILVLNNSKREFHVRYEDEKLSNDPIIAPIQLNKITKVSFEKQISTKIVELHFSGNVLVGNRCFMEFKSEKSTVDFINAILDLNVKHALRSNTYLTAAMSKLQTEASNFVINKKDINHAQTSEQDLREKKRKISPMPSTSVKRQRLVDALDAAKPCETTNASLDISEFFYNQTRQTAKSHTGRKDQRLTQNNGEDKPPQSPERQTRSRKDGRSVNDHVREQIVVEPGPKRSERANSPWKKPLVYPKIGKKRETVDYGDLVRLNDDEFLNDSLVGLFLRYLQEHTNEDLMKRMHFFNSFFFETLTKDGRGNRKSINYQGVASWTKKINIFSREFVVVPVNENLHWFVMIICNLQNLKKPADLEGNDTEIETIEQNPQDDIESKIILTSDLLSPQNSTEKTRRSFSELNLNDQEYRELQSGTQLKLSINGKRGSAKKNLLRSHRKYDITEPVIITLDSLGISRSSTATILKQYIVEEAKQKLNLDIDREDIRGMTAKDVPGQNNFSDCGLYLCMYIEQFMRDPHLFVRNILQREKAGPRWPQQVHSADLRDRLMNMIIELHTEQEDENYQAKVQNIGCILVDMLESNNDLYNRAISSQVWYADHKRQQSESGTKHQSQLDQSEIVPNHDIVDNEDGLICSKAEYLERMREQNTITIDDGSQKIGKQPKLHKESIESSHIPKETKTKSPYFPLKTVDHRNEYSQARDGSNLPDVEIPTLEQDGQDTPDKLALRLKSGRSQSENGQRSQSCSTDYLTGTDSYIRESDVEDMRNEADEQFRIIDSTGMNQTPEQEGKIPSPVPNDGDGCQISLD